MIFFPVLSACLLSIKINLAFHLYAFSEFLKSHLRIFRYPKILFPPVERSFPELHSWRVYYLPWRFSLNPFADFTSHETSWYHDVMNPNLTSSWCRRCHMYTKVPMLVPSVVHSVSGKGKLATQSDSRAFRFAVSFLILISWYLILVFAFFLNIYKCLLLYHFSMKICCPHCHVCIIILSLSKKCESECAKVWCELPIIHFFRLDGA